MAKISWEFDNYVFPLNPSQDSGWIPDVILSEQNPINANYSKFQRGGMKSSRRQISGYFYGVKAEEQAQKFRQWLSAGTIAVLKDHIGLERRAMLVKISIRPVQDVGALNKGRNTYQYDAEFVRIGN